MRPRILSGSRGPAGPNIEFLSWGGGMYAIVYPDETSVLNSPRQCDSAAHCFGMKLEANGLPWQCYLPVAFVFRAEIATKNLYTRGQKRSPKKSRGPRFRDEDLNVLFFLVRQAGLCPAPSCAPQRSSLQAT